MPHRANGLSTLVFLFLFLPAPIPPINKATIYITFLSTRSRDGIQLSKYSQQSLCCLQFRCLMPVPNANELIPNSAESFAQPLKLDPVKNTLQERSSEQSKRKTKKKNKKTYETVHTIPNPSRYLAMRLKYSEEKRYGCRNHSSALL